jgi:ABC-type nickel/cobalt efflux system permease component RcnA
MLVLGLLLVVMSGAMAAVLIAYNAHGATDTVWVFGRDIADVTVQQAFIAGIVVALLFVLGIWLIVAGGRRVRDQRAEFREARREAIAAARERDELAEMLRQEDTYRGEQETDFLPAGVGNRGGNSGRRHTQPVITNINDGGGSSI